MVEPIKEPARSSSGYRHVIAGCESFAASALPAWLVAAADSNQRPCKLWERVPSCNKGLIEYVHPNVCAPPKVRFVCGGLNQRPCKVFERIPSCDRGLAEDFIKNLCVKKSNLNSAAALGKQCYRDFKPMAPSFLRVALCFYRPPVLRILKPLLRKKQNAKLKDFLLAGTCAPELKAAASVMQSRGFKSLSIGIGGEVGAIVGANSQFFVALDTTLRGKAYVYETLGWQIGTAAGGSVNAIVTAYYPRASQLAGKGQGFSVSLKALGGAGGAVGLSYAERGQSPRCTSFSAGVGAGAEANAGSLSRTTTLRLTN